MVPVSPSAGLARSRMPLVFARPVIHLVKVALVQVSTSAPPVTVIRSNSFPLGNVLIPALKGPTGRDSPIFANPAMHRVPLAQGKVLANAKLALCLECCARGSVSRVSEGSSSPIQLASATHVIIHVLSALDLIPTSA